MGNEKSKKKKLTLFDCIVIAFMASMGIAVKVVIVPLTQIITGALFIPGGVVAGGFYMAFIVLSSELVKKRGTATLTALLQAVVVTITGTLGSHGALSLLTYTLPGFFVDVVFLILRSHGNSSISAFIGGMVANLVGSFAVNLAIFNLSIVPLLLSLLTACLTGGLGGLVAYSISKNLHKMGVVK